MSYGSPHPSKKEVALSILENGNLLIHLDPRRAGVVVPPSLRALPRLTLEVGYRMAVRIPDLVVDDAGISATLSFNRSPSWCSLPWSSVFALVGKDGQGMVWQEDVPPDHAEEDASAAGGTAVEASAQPLRCSFCRKTQHEVRKLIAGPDVYICDECVYLCVEILNEEPVEAQPSG